MTDRPIIFSRAMVRALLDGRKTQTRRLATSPLRRCEAGDRLWVREAFAVVPATAYRMSQGVEQRTNPADSHMAAIYAAGWDRSVPTWRPSIHMPRWASRLTLVVDLVRVQPLDGIAEHDAVAEGLTESVWDVKAGDDAEMIEGWSACRFHAFKHSVGETAREGYEILWNSLHSGPGGRWADNPAVVALTFHVERRNIDELPS